MIPMLDDYIYDLVLNHQLVGLPDAPGDAAAFPRIGMLPQPSCSAHPWR